jgi:5-methylcytosine-specific restriction enzyme A
MQTLKPRISIGSHAAIRIFGSRSYRKKSTVDRLRVCARDKHLCQACLEQGRVTLGDEVDHIVPLQQGGSDDDSNKRLLCRPCHKAKTARELAR